MGGFIWHFFSKFGSPKTQRLAQRILKDRQLFDSKQEAWKRVCDEYPEAMRSNDPNFVKKTLEAARANAEVDEKKERILTGNLRHRLQELQKANGDKNTPSI